MPYKNIEDRRAQVKRWKQANPESVRRGHVKLRYGLSAPEHDELLKRQGFKCGFPDCGKAVDLFSPIDHSHTTGKVRGILCVFHNTALGFFEKLDLNAVFAYLKN
jgi:Recombination endonuclease VII